MMLRADIFNPEDLLLIEPQDSQLLDIPADKRLEYGWQFAEGGSAFTIWGETPAGLRPIFCAGALRRHPGYVELWAVFSRYRNRVPMFVTRATRNYIASLTERRISTQVAASNRGACGWARLVGLEEETRLRHAMPDGSDMIIFVKKGLL